MTQTRTPRRVSPKQAAKLRRPIDSLLDAGMFKALGDPTRLMLLSCLAKCARPCSVGEVAECCSVDLSVVSRHLATLARAGLVEPTRQGQSVLYRVRYVSICKTLRDLASAIDACCPDGDNKGSSCCASR